MREFFESIMPNVIPKLPALWNATLETLAMTGISALYILVIGMALGILLTVTKKGGLLENAVVYRVLDIIINLLRSVPFIILLFLLIPLTRIISGTSIGVAGSIFPLIVGTVPFFSRQAEAALAGVNPGLIEAAQSMGANIPTIIFKVLIPEAKTSLIVGATISCGTILGYSAMSGAIGGGGLGQIAISYGYNRYQTDVLFVTVALLIVLMQVIQIVGMKISRKTDKRVRN